MTVTLEIPAELEKVLSAKANLFGLALPDYLFSVLEANTDDEYSLTVKEIASVQEALADRKMGNKGISLEELDERMKVNKERRNQQTVEVAA